MAQLETWYKQDLKKPLVVHRHADVFNQDSRGNLIGVEIYSDGEPVTLTGSIDGYCLLADGTTVSAVGANRTGNKASILIPQTAYNVPGPITITIKNTDGNDITTLCAVVGLVRQSVSGNLVQPGDIVTDWSQSINSQLQAVQDAADNVGAIVAAPFAKNTAYVVGNYVTYNGNLYRITADHAAGVTWANTAKTQCTVGTELYDLKSAIDGTEIVPLYDDCPQNIGYINVSTGLWARGSSSTVTYGFCIVPVQPGDAVVINGNGSNKSNIAFLKSFSAPVIGEAPDFSEASGYTSAIEIANTATYTATVPNDTYFIYVYGGTNGAVNRLPSVFTVNGYDMMKSARDNIAENYNTLAEDVRENTDGIDSMKTVEKNTGWNVPYSFLYSGLFIDSETGKWATATGSYTAYCTIIPVKGNEFIYINGNATTKSVFAFLTSLDYTEGATVAFSAHSGYTSIVQMNVGQEVYTGVPADARYLYIYNGLEMTNNRMPVELTIDGISIYGSARNEITGKIETLKNEATGSGVAVLDAYLKRFPLYINGNIWSFLTYINTAIGYYVIPVKPGDSLQVCGNNSSTTSIAIVKSYSAPIENDLIDFSDDFTSLISITKNNYRALTIPDDANYFLMYAGTTTSDRRPAHLYLNGYDLMAPASVNITNAGIQPVKIKIMQYNIGKYNWGSAGGLPEAQLEEKTNNYKRFFSRESADIIGIEEFVQYMDEQSTQDADETLYNFLYPYSVWNTDYQRNIKSKYPLVYSLTGSLQTGSPVKYARYSFARILINNRIVAVFCTALPHQNDAATMQARAELMALAVQMMANDDYAFIVSDFNCSGNGSDVSSEQEMINMNTALANAGWMTCNGNYLPVEITFPSTNRYLDNIAYKNNGKVQFSNFAVLSEVYDDLSSDHYPVTGEFILF